MKWKNKFYVMAYQLSCDGAADETIAKQLGVSRIAFRKWKKKRPTLRFALEEGRKGRDGKGTFQDYIYSKLDEKSKETWDRLMQMDKEKAPEEQIKWLLHNTPTTIRQHLFLHAMFKYNFNATKACTMMRIRRQTYENWAKTDPEFATLLAEINWHKGNFYESQLHKLVREKEPSAVLFVARTFNRDRGYNDKFQMDVNLSGKVEHTHTFDLSQLDLSEEVLEAIAVAIEKREKAMEKETIDLEADAIRRIG